MLSVKGLLSLLFALLALPLSVRAAGPGALGNTEDALSFALSFALEAAGPYVKKGFTIREDFWGGDLPANTPKPIVHQLFKGNEYWFWMGSDEKDAKISVHVYDSAGHIAESEAWQKPHFAGVRVTPKNTGSYYIIVEVEKSPAARTRWALAYGYR